MGRDTRLWRKQVKKLRRQRKRRLRAQLELEGSKQSVEVLEEKVASEDANSEDDASDAPEVDDNFFLERSEWAEREEQARLESLMKKAEEDHRAEIEAENQRRIKAEWEAKMEQERKLAEEKDRLEKQMKEKQEAEFDEFLGFLSGDIETPPTKYLMPEDVDADESNLCYYFAKTATCRHYARCTKSHPRPTLSTAILIPNFFSHFKLEQSVRDEYDSDLGLEYDDKELYNEFLEFYDDVVPELRKSGALIQFKVCCNLEPHLRGNVYVQYQTIREAIEAFRKFNGRFYNGRQLSLQFIKMDSWRSAICGSFLRKACVKGRTCNYLHVFRNPTKEFVQADHDWKEYQRPVISTLISRRTFNQTLSTPANSTPQLNAASVLLPLPHDQVLTETEKSTNKNRTEGIKLTETGSSVIGSLDQDSLSSSSQALRYRATSNPDKRTDPKSRTKRKHSKPHSSSNEKHGHREKHKSITLASPSSSSLSPMKRKKSKRKKKKEKKSKKRKKHSREK